MNHVPLTSIAAELGLTAAELVQRFGDAVTLDDIGFRCVPADVARTLIADHRAALQAERDREAAAREAAAREPNLGRERRRALAARQAVTAGPDAPALGLMMAGEHTDRERLYGGALTYHSLNTQKG